MDKQLAATIGTNAREARTRAGLTQADVAEQLGVAVEVYGRLERALMLPSVPTLRKLALALKVPADHLLGLASGEPLSAAPAAPENGRSPELRRLIRRASGLGRRKIRLLGVLAAALARNKRREPHGPPAPG